MNWSRCRYAHAGCLALSPEVRRSGGHVFSGVAALRRGRGLKCSHCGKKGATVGCALAACKHSFHAPCALFHSGGCLDPTGPETAPLVYCAEHRTLGSERWAQCSKCDASEGLRGIERVSSIDTSFHSEFNEAPLRIIERP